MAIITREMATKLTLDTSNAQSALRDFQREANSTTREWKATTSQLKASGDYAEATSVKLKGLGATIGIQKEKISTLRSAIENVNTSTKKGTNLYNYLQKELEKAERQLGSFTGQQERAKAMDRYYQSGLAELNQTLHRNIDITNIREQRLQAQGREEAAVRVHTEGLKTSQEQYSNILKIQEQELIRVGRETGKSSDAYHQQALRVEQTKKQLAETTTEYKRYQSGLAAGDQKIKELNATIGHNNDLFKANAQKLELAGDHNGALQTKLAGTKLAFEKQSHAVSEQRTQLKRLESSENTSSSAIVKQRAELAKTELKLAEYGKAIRTTQTEVDHLNPYGFTKMGRGMNSVYQQSTKLNESMHNGFQKLKSGALSASFGVLALGGASVKGAKMASDLENQYRTTYNLLITGGEKAAEATHNVTKMQTEGRKMSVEYGVSQDKIADGYQELVKRGYSSAQALGAMKTMLQGSVASGDDFADVVHNSTAALESFGKKTDSVAGMTKNTKEVVNQMAFAADMTATDFKSMGTALEYTGATAHQSGLSLSETASAIGVLSNNGLEADKAGTGLRKAISSLQSPTKGASSALHEIGLSTKDFVDKSGKMKSMTDIFGLLNEHSKNLSKFEKGQLFHALFGATGEQAGAILAQNSDELGKLNKKVEESAKGQGYVAELSRKNMGSVKNELAQFKEAGNATLIMIGKEMLPVLRDASVQMVKTFDSKQGQAGLKSLAHGVGELFALTEKGVTFLGTHTTEVKVFAAALGTLWATKKIGDFIIMVKDAKKTLLEFQAVNAALDVTGGGGFGKLGKTIKGTKGATVAAEGASTISSGVSGVGSAEMMTTAATKAAPALSKVLMKTAAVGVGGGVISGITEAASNKPMHEKVGGTLGGGIGTAAGMFFGGPFGAMIGGTVGQKAGEMLGDAVQKGLNRKRVKPKMSVETQSPSMRKLDRQYRGFIDKLNDKLVIDPTLNEKNLDRDKKAVDRAYKGMSKSIEGFYKRKQASSKKDLDSLVRNGLMSQKEEDAILKKSKSNDNKQIAQKRQSLKKMKDDSNQYYAQLRKIADGNTKKLQEIEKKYGKKSSQYKKEQQKERTKANERYQKQMVKDEEKFGNDINKTTRAASIKQQDILNDLKKKKGKISHEEMRQAISDSAKQKNIRIRDADETYKKTVRSAKRKKDETIRAADREYYENGTISKKQHDDIVGKANSTYKEAVGKAEKRKNESISKAQAEHKGVVDQATKQAGEHKSAVDSETGNVMTVWNDFVSSLADTVNDITGGINALLKFIDKKHPGHIPKWTPANYVHPKKHAAGHQGIPTDEIALVGEEGFELAHHPQKGIFALGTQGPEITHLQAGTSILPHGLSKEFMAMTSGLPAHKNGVPGLLGDAFNFAKDMFKDVEETLSAGPKKALDLIEDKVGVKPFIDKYSESGIAVHRFAQGGIDTISDSILKMLKGIFKKAEKEISSKDIGAGGNWRSQIKKAADEAHVKLGPGDLQAIMARINKESGGRQNIKQQIDDVNSRSGNPAQGLLQYIPPTFRSWAVSGHTNILSGYDQLMAMFNDSNWRSDIRMPGGWGPTGHRRLENGGLTNKHQMVEISEGNLPEMTIPLSKVKDSRGYELLGKTVSMFAARDNLNSASTNSLDVKNLETKVDKMIDLLSTVVTNTAQNHEAVIDQKTWYQKQNSDRQLAQRQDLTLGF